MTDAVFIKRKFSPNASENDMKFAYLIELKGHLLSQMGTEHPYTSCQDRIPFTKECMDLAV